MVNRWCVPRAMMISAVIAGAVVSGGCSTTGRDASGAPQHIVTASGAERSNDETSLKAGETLQVRLPSQSGTGYSWRLASDGGMNSVIWFERQEKEMISGSKSMGGQIYQGFDFRSVGPGSSKLVFVYDRPWETNVAPAKEFVLTVNVKLLFSRGGHAAWIVARASALRGRGG